MSAPKRIPFSIVYQNISAAKLYYKEYQIEIELPIYKPRDKEVIAPQNTQKRGETIISLFGEDKI